jgi:2-dehydropantoate 2-reductase
LGELSEVFRGAGIEVEVKGNAKALKWSKLIVNLATNALSAITRLPNASLPKVDGMKEAMAGAVDEGLRVAKALGIALDANDAAAYISSGTTHDPRHKSSMLVDIEMGRQTEIDYMNGAVVKYGKQCGVPTPINSTLVAAIKALEYTSMNK